MQTYEYKGFDAAGKPCRGLVEALSAKQARETLAARGVLAERLEVSSARPLGRVSAEARAMVYRGVGSLLSAGLTLVASLDVLIGSPELQACRGWLAGARDRVREGVPLAEALSAGLAVVSAFEVAVIQAAERSGTVELMLTELATFIEEQQRLRERVKGALIYPAIIFTVGIVVSIVMLGVLVPRTQALVGGGRMELPALTVAMMTFGRLCMTWGFVVLAALLAGLGYFVRRLRRDIAFRMRWHARLFALPVIGRASTILANLRFARTLAILVRGGATLIDGVVLAGKATGNAWLAAQAETQAETIRHGASLSAAVRALPPLAGSMPGWIEIGEASGNLESLLATVGARYQEQWDRYITRCLGLLEPILIAVIGGIVLLVTLSVLLPVLNLSSAIGR